MAKKPKKLDEISKKFGAEREKALNDALKLIEKDFGKGSIMRLGERACLLYTSPSPRDVEESRMPSSA